jgi:small-conductance mechanosensitive channel
LQEFTILNIAATKWIFSVLVLLALSLFFRFFKKSILKNLKKLAKKTETDFDDTLVQVLDEIPAYFYRIVAAFLAFYHLTLGLENQIFSKTLKGVFIVFVIYRVILFLQKFLSYALERALSKNQGDETALHGIRIILNIALWSIGILVVLQNLGFEISTLVTGLGIGGVAIAFAFQSILSDLFASFAIYFDKPFKIGDFIVIGTDSGNIKKIGLKTTRIRTLRGEELIVSNAELTSTRIKNLKRMTKRRVEFPFGVTYSTSSKKLRAIPEIVEEIIKKQELAEFSRCHFHEFGDFSLNFVVVYHVLNREYGDYMDLQQAINFEIKEAFEKEKIEMAFPTQTVYLEK